MWQTKTFKTREQFNCWVDKWDNKMQWEEIFVCNGFGLVYRPLRVI